MSKNIHAVLGMYGFIQPMRIKQIDNKSVWQINDNYILKEYSCEEEAEKALLINKFLREESIPVFEYIENLFGNCRAAFDGGIYTLMRKVNGKHIEFTNPFSGDYQRTARNIGVELARLHKALKRLGGGIIGTYESDLINELNRSLAEIRSHNIDIPCRIVNSCLEFAGDYRLLPRQLIHRDVHFGNMLFENGRLKAFLDFDSSEESVRIFDIAYFGQSILFTNNYTDDKFITQWVKFFASFLHGYNTENILCENEIKSIYMMCVVLQIGFISYYLGVEEKKGLIPSRMEMAKWIYSHELIFTL